MTIICFCVVRLNADGGKAELPGVPEGQHGRRNGGVHVRRDHQGHGSAEQFGNRVRKPRHEARTAQGHQQQACPQNLQGRHCCKFHSP